VDIISIVVLVLVFAMTVLISYRVISDWDDKTAAIGVPAVYATNSLNALKVFNYGFLFIFVGSMIATIITAFSIRTHPAFFIVSLIVFAIVIALSAILSNVFEEFIVSDLVSGITSNFGVMINIMQNLPMWVTGLGAAILIALYAKSRGGDGF